MTRISWLTPDRGFYQPGSPVRLRLRLEATSQVVAVFRIFHLEEQVEEISISEDPYEGRPGELEAVWTPPEIAPRGYGVEVEVSDGAGVTAAASTAFDVLEAWTDHPRYGFLCDFGHGRDDLDVVFEELTLFHVNGIQFYDWHYRHDDLVPPSELFEDPLGRQLSLATIQELVRHSLARGMAPMAYMAVYAASMEFWRTRPEWAMYEDGKALTFMDDFLGLMDPSPNRGWAKHILASCDQTLDEFPFAGIHVDQYGEPRTAFDVDGHEIDLPAAFAGFVGELKERHPRSSTTFNAVKNWPIDALLDAPMDFVYIELWEDMPHYRDLASVAEHAHRVSRGKPVVIALYIPAEREENVLLANAVIAANGGSRIEIGETGRLLANPYFPLHEEVSPRLRTDLLRQHDFRVRYGELLATSTEPTRVEADAGPGIWVTTRRSDRWLAATLVNMVGREDSRWDEVHEAPTAVENVRLTLGAGTEVAAVLVASPDSDDRRLRPLDWSQDRDVVEVTVPSLQRMALIAVRLEEGR